MMFGPAIPMMRERMEPLMRDRIQPLMREQLEPLLRERMNDLPDRIQFRAPFRVRTLEGPAFSDLIDISDFDEPLLLEMDDEPFDFEMEIVPVSADTIREIAATTIRSAQCALKQLAAEGIA